MKSPIDLFFKMSDKVSQGDPLRKAKFDYYLLWVIFFAFALILVSNLTDYFQTGKLSNIGWALVMGSILWFQYFGLKQARAGVIAMEDFRKNIGLKPSDPTPKQKVENTKDMLEEFK